MSDLKARTGKALVDFASNGTFPEDEGVSAGRIEGSGLPAAYRALSDAKIALETEIRQISRDSSSDVDTWMSHAQALQADIESSRKLASDIVRQAEADEDRIAALQDQETHVTFLEQETLFNSQLNDALISIKDVHERLDKAEKLATQRRILEPIQILADSWALLDTIPVDKSARAIRMLDNRCFDLRGFAHEQFKVVWKQLVHLDPDEKTLTINQSLKDEFTNMDQAIIVLKAYKELDATAKRLAEDIDDIILKPRTDTQGPLLSIKVTKNSVTVNKGKAPNTLKPLFQDLEDIIQMLVANLPPDFRNPLAEAMMPTLSKRIKEEWLDTAVPASLEDMMAYQKSLAQVQEFAKRLDSIKWPGTNGFYDWVTSAPKIWLSKRRETTLDWTRNQLSLGVGTPQFAEHIEKHMVAREEGKQIATTGNLVNQDWDAAWDSDEDEKQEEIPTGANRASLDEQRRHSQLSPAPNSAQTPTTDNDDDGADAWGWGDDDGAEISPVLEHSNADRPQIDRAVTPEMREVTLSEPYWTSSMPKPLFQTITDIYGDGADLTKKGSESIPVTAAAVGLFSLPTLVLAMYRAVSPYYYSHDPSGNMYIYNDSMWLCDRLKEYASEWESRNDLTPRAYGMVKLDPEIKVLQSFGKRAYTNEMTSQRTIINDILGGAQNFLQGAPKEELESGIHSVISHIRQTAAMWKKILPYSAWASAVGSLVNTVASKIISDVFDLSSMDVDEAEQTATLISKVSKLDDLFIRSSDSKSTSNGASESPRKDNIATNEEAPIPMTAQFADKWMKMKFLSEVLQGDLKDIKYFWFESDLSLYFTKEETVDLILLSFEDNANVRGLVKEIRGSEMGERVG